MIACELEPVTANSADYAVASLRRALSRSPYVAIRALACDHANGRLVVRGRLPNLHTRQIALSLLARYSDALDLEDQIKVSEL